MVSGLALCLFPAVLILYGVRKLRERSWGRCKNFVQLNNKIAIITGANSGIGYEIAKELALRNAEVILACRNVDAGKKAIMDIQKEIKNSTKMVVMELDLASLKSIKNFATNVKKLYRHIHLLINNAGVSYPNTQLHQTKDGIEIHFGVNHLGHFYLTNLLLDTLQESTPSRIIIVSSTLHQKGIIDIENLSKIEVTSKTNLYADSKLANMYFCREFSKKFGKCGVNVYGVCPGWVYTNLFRYSLAWYHYIVIAPIAFFFMRSPKQGAQTPLYCATEPSLENETGLFYRDCKRYKSKIDFDDKIASQLWEKSEKMIEAVIKD